MADNAIDLKVDQKEFVAGLAAIERMHDAIDERWIKSTQRRALKPMVNAMKANSKSGRIAQMIGITTAKTKTPPLGAKVGVIKNDASLFPKFTAPALASVLEYGVDEERFRTLRAGAIVTGRQSTGTMPATPFLRPAWDMNVNPFMESVMESIERKIEREFTSG